MTTSFARFFQPVPLCVAMLRAESRSAQVYLKTMRKLHKNEEKKGGSWDTKERESRTISFLRERRVAMAAFMETEANGRT